jgi:hypothetical protein
VAKIVSPTGEISTANSIDEDGQDKARTKAALKSGFTLIAKGVTAMFDPTAIGDFLTTAWDEVDKVCRSAVVFERARD